MHRIYDIIERIGEPQNVALRNIVERTYQVNSIKEVHRTFHIFLGVSSQLLCDQLISKDEMNIMQHIFCDYCINRYDQLKLEKQSQEQDKKKFKFW